ncbi:AAA family ATPase [Catalinimonas niigatensis]|uniref:AAA family ATPase n=1 Tax=Catalinimonas niigatensis TaxID=1397264 RepID=UPI0026655303|nr:AAA family ATPase [Catalinimonas niigatensis]WPP49495.1 SbcC/MukB-like Walker B domain-containing protein [Catalinimonas niigatensis]
MIPVELKLKGLYSYREQQTIDFTKLTSSQLFGIFGSVGCGKSSILEAIMFVLYDRSDRLNQKDNRYYNMLNLQCDEMEIDFIFMAEARNKSRYRFYFRAGRNRKNYDQVVLRDRNYYKEEEGNWLPIAVKDASELLGMNYDHFMQTVIIPQGKFREFVDQGASQRTQMLKELFNLNQYELANKVKVLINRNKTALTEVQARLAEVGGICEEEIQEFRKNVDELEKDLQGKQAQEKKIDESCKAQEALYKLFDALARAVEELDNLQQQKPHFARREKRLSDYNKAYTHFKERIQLQRDIKLEIRQLADKRKQMLVQIKEQEFQLVSAREALHQRQKDYEQRETDILKCQDLEYVIKIREFKEAHAQVTAKLVSIQKEVKKLDETLIESKKQLADEEHRLEEMDAKLRFRTKLQDIHHWHQQQCRLQKEQEQCKQQHDQYKKQIQSLLRKKDVLLFPFSWAQGVDETDALKNLIREQIKINKAQQAKVTDHLQELQIKEKLSSYAEDLEEGKPCLLCGSVNHPNVALTESVHQELEEHHQQMKALQEEENKIRALAEDIIQLESEFKSTQTLLEKAEAGVAEVQAKLAQHQETFLWEDFSKYTAEEIQQFIQKLEALSEQAEQNRHKIQLHKNELPTLEQQCKAAQENLVEVRQKEHALKISIDNHLALLRVYAYEGWINHNLSELKQSLERGQRKVKEAEEHYKQAVRHFNECEMALHGTQSKAETERERLEQLEERAHKLEEEIQELCQQKQFKSITEVHELLALDLDIEAEQKAIQTYNTSLSSIQDQLNKLNKEAEGKSYDNQLHESILLELQQIKEAVQQCQERAAVAREQVKRMEERLQNSQQLQKKQESLLIREDSLKELASLFKGSGFVRYVSSVYLDNLCRTANERFRKLTRNNLSLELDEEGEFIVRDFLNNGKTRLLKTLSGGQTFQAALCMALALAENVKALNQAEQSFFFLDEGFGSLDKESLRLVFDTLKSLRQEHRIVGIISHVEELQQEIDVFLKIENDKERGSLISRSWE